MTENNHGSQPERQLSPEEQLDLLLEKFLNDPNDEIPTVDDLMPKQDAPEEVIEDTTSLPEAEMDDRFESLWEESEEAEDVAPMAELAPLDEAEFTDFMESQEEEPAEECETQEEVEDTSVEEFAEEEEAEDETIVPMVFFPEAETKVEEIADTAEAAEEELQAKDFIEDDIAEAEVPSDAEDNTIVPMVSFPENEEEPAVEEAAEDAFEEEPAEEAENTEEASEYDTTVPVIPSPEEDELQEEETEVSAEEMPAEVETEDTAEEYTEENPVVPVVIIHEGEETPENNEEETQQEPTEEEVSEDDTIVPAMTLPEDDELQEEAEEATEETPAEVETEDTAEEYTEEDETEGDPVVSAVVIPESEEIPENNEEEPQQDPAEDASEDNDIVPAMIPSEEEPPAEENSESQVEEPSSEEPPANDVAVAPQPVPATPQVPSEEDEDWDEDEEDWDEDEEEYEDDEEPLPPPKKRRPKNNKKYGFFGIPHILATFVWLGIIVFIGVGLGQLIWNCAADVLALGREDSEVAITIDEADDLQAVANKLHTLGLIRYPSLFVIYGDISDAMDSIRVGSYTLNTLYDYHALVDAMSSNQRRITTNVTIPEGYTCAQIFKLLETKGISTVAKLEAAAINGELGDYWFLEGVEQNAANCLEGFLFPDTYTFYLDHDPVGVLKKFLDNFNKRFNESMQIKLDTLNATLSEKMRANGLSEEYIAEHQMTVRDIVIIASMIEKETASAPESYNISSVIYNRLADPDNYPYLNIDAALVYVLGHGDLTMEDLQFDSPYNTYLYPGLIPGAIANPGSYSLDAALDPTQTDYYFYALDPSTGEHHFSKTLKEHNDFLDSIRKEEEPEDTEE